MPWMPGIPTEAVTAYPGSVHNGLTQRLELQLRWSRYGTTHSPRCHSPPLWTVGAVADFRECHESLCWGHVWPLIESSLAFSALGQKRAYSASGAASWGCWPATEQATHYTDSTHPWGPKVAPASIYVMPLSRIISC